MKLRRVIGLGLALLVSVGLVLAQQMPKGLHYTVLAEDSGSSPNGRPGFAHVAYMFNGNAVVSALKPHLDPDYPGTQVIYRDGKTRSITLPFGEVESAHDMNVALPVTNGASHLLFQVSSRKDSVPGPHDLYELNIKTREFRKLDRLPYGSSDAMYSPDGSKIITYACFPLPKSSDPNGISRKLLLYNRATGRRTVLTDKCGVVDLRGWSQTGDRVFYQEQSGSDASSLKQIMVRTGACSTLVAHLRLDSLGGMAVIGDGRKIVYCSAEDCELRLLDIVSKKDTLIVKTDHWIQDPQVDASGRYVAVFKCGRAYGTRIFDLMDASGKSREIANIRGWTFVQWHPSRPCFIAKGSTFFSGKDQIREYSLSSR